jgi:hypothetical protein
MNVYAKSKYLSKTASFAVNNWETLQEESRPLLRHSWQLPNRPTSDHFTLVFWHGWTLIWILLTF